MKNKFVIYSVLFIIIILVFILGNHKSNNQVSYKTISPTLAKERIDSDANVIILDVRTIEEYKEGHIKNSVLIPLDKINAEVENKIKDKKTTIFVYCRSGNRSKSASDILLKLGYENVYDLGGIINWNYEIEKG